MTTASAEQGNRAVGAAPAAKAGARVQGVGRWPRLERLWSNRWVRFVSLTLYYLAILMGLIYLYGRGDFSTPPFIYQGF